MSPHSAMHLVLPSLVAGRGENRIAGARGDAWEADGLELSTGMGTTTPASRG